MTISVRLPVLLALVVLIAGAPACSLRKIAINSVADTLAKSGDTFASDEDPELIRDAVPFSLKLVEAFLSEVPGHRGLLLTACSGFTQYAYAFIDSDAEQLKLDDYMRYVELQDRARMMYIRGRNYCLRSLELGYPGFRRKLELDPDRTVLLLDKKDVPLIYWAGASWGKAVSISLDRPALAGDFPIARALLRRALELDEAFKGGAVHEAMITVEALPPEMGGNPERAKEHYARAMELSKGNSAGAHVSYAMGVLLPNQDKKEFVELLNKAVAVDVDREPRLRLANILAQRYARYLLNHLDGLFLFEQGEGEP